MIILEEKELVFKIADCVEDYKELFNLIKFHQLHHPPHIGSNMLNDFKFIFDDKRLPKEVERKKTVIVKGEKITFPYRMLMLVCKDTIPVGVIFTAGIWTNFWMKKEERKKGYTKKAWFTLMKFYKTEKVKFSNSEWGINLEPFFLSLGNVKFPFIEREKAAIQKLAVMELFGRIPGVTVTEIGTF